MSSGYVEHVFPPEYDVDSRVLILGTIPSPKSREKQFYYMHPQNRFWRLLYDVFEEPFETEISVRKDFLKRHHIALWDVLASCEIAGASDSSIRNAKPNDLSIVLSASQVRTIFVTGKTAQRYYLKYCRAQTGQDCIYLPSPSPVSYTHLDVYKRQTEILSRLMSYNDSDSIANRASCLTDILFCVTIKEKTGRLPYVLS